MLLPPVHIKMEFVPHGSLSLGGAGISPGRRTAVAMTDKCLL